MVIDSNNSIKNTGPGPNGSRGPAGASTAGRTTQATGSTSASSEDSVVLSAEARSLKNLQDKMGNLPDVNSERVASIKQAIAEGRFSINAERIAEKLLNQDDLLR